MPPQADVPSPASFHRCTIFSTSEVPGVLRCLVAPDRPAFAARAGAARRFTCLPRELLWTSEKFVPAVPKKSDKAEVAQPLHLLPELRANVLIVWKLLCR